MSNDFLSFFFFFLFIHLNESLHNGLTTNEKQQQPNNNIKKVSQYHYQIAHCWLFRLVGGIAYFIDNLCFIQVSLNNGGVCPLI